MRESKAEISIQKNKSPKWSADGKYVAFISDKSGRDEIWISDPEGRNLKQITSLDNEKGAPTWTPDSKALLYSAADKRLYSYTVADGKTGFVFHDYSAAALLETLRRALVAFSDPAGWRALQRAGMAQDHSWDRSARPP